MSLHRVRLSFSHMSVEPKNCWFLVDTSVCRVVADLEYLIRERFELRKLEHGGAIDLFLDEYLLPSQEKIDVIRDNDVIRVQESVLHTEIKGTPGIPRSTKQKGNNIGGKFSKRKHLQVSADEDEEEHDTTQAKWSKKPPVVKTKQHKSKTLPLKNGISPASERFGKKDKKLQGAKQVKHKRHSTKHKNECKSNPVAVTKRDTTHVEVSEPKRKSSKDRVGSGNTVSPRSTCSSSSISSVVDELSSQSDTASAENDYLSVPQVIHRRSDNERSVVSAAGSTPSADLANGSSLITSTPLGSQTDSRNVRNIQKNNISEKYHFPRNQMEQGKPKLPVRKPSTGVLSGASLNNSTHVRFDSEDEHDPQGSEVKSQEVEVTVSAPVVTCLRGTESTVSHNATPTTSFGAQLQRHWNDVEQISVTRQQSAVIDRVVSASLTPGQKQEPECSKSQPLGKVPKDYSQFVALHGPPRANDRIAYKILELSASYTPEISDYKEGTVLGYDSKSDTVHLELTIESLEKPLGDGNVSQKFELIYEVEGEEDGGEKVVIPVSEENRKVAVLWSSMREPLLLSGGSGN